MSHSVASLPLEEASSRHRNKGNWRCSLLQFQSSGAAVRGKDVMQGIRLGLGFGVPVGP